MKALITGSKGFVGSQLALALKKCQEYNVFEMDKEYFSRLDDWEKNLVEQLDLIKPDAVFHVGALTNTLETEVNNTMLKNYEATKVLVNWCKNNKSYIIYSSSAANYGTNGRTPSNLYGWSKYVAEDYVTNNGGIALRYFNVYGPGEEHKGKMASFLYQAFTKNRNKEKISLFPKKPKRDFVHVKDIITANIFALENYNKLKKTYYEVGTSHATSFEQLMKYMGLKYQYHDQAEIPEGYQFYTCSKKDKWLPGWRPSLTTEEGVLQYKIYLNDERVTKT